MCAEFDHVDEKSDVLGWAIGCVVASYAERIRFMNRSSLLVSKWVIGLEALLCFGPLTLLWLVAVAKLPQFMGEPKVLFDIAVITISPLSLLLALRFVLFGNLLRRNLLISLAIAFLAVGVLMIAGKWLRAGRAFLWSDVEWNLPILVSIMPALCCWHLSLFAKNPPESLRIA